MTVTYAETRHRKCGVCHFLILRPPTGQSRNLGEVMAQKMHPILMMRLLQHMSAMDMPRKRPLGSSGDSPVLSLDTLRKLDPVCHPLRTSILLAI
jgi:hypothetical protein